MGMNDFKLVLLQCQYKFAVLRIERTSYPCFLGKVLDDRQHRITRRVLLVTPVASQIFRILHHCYLSPSFSELSLLNENSTSTICPNVSSTHTFKLLCSSDNEVKYNRNSSFSNG